MYKESENEYIINKQLLFFKREEKKRKKDAVDAVLPSPISLVVCMDG